MDRWMAERRAEAARRQELIERAAASGVLAGAAKGFCNTLQVTLSVAKLEEILARLEAKR